MRRFTLGLTAAALFAALSAVALVGCGGLREDDDGGPPRKRTGGGGGPGTSGPALKPVKATAWGVIRGEVAWTGSGPSLAPLNFTSDKDECAKGDEYETNDASYWVGENNKLGNVFVWIEPEDGHYFEVPDDQLSKYKGKKVVVGQPHCAFLPRCSVLFPSYYKDGKRVPTGEELLIKNDARITHNANIDNTGKPGALPPLKGEATMTLAPAKKTLEVVCNIHPWMRGFLRPYDHPYAAVTHVGSSAPDAKPVVYQNRKDPKFGTYEITGVPVGATVTLRVWHEKLQEFSPPRKVTLKAVNEGADFNFTAAPK
jgi:hypothetical protein